MLFMNTSPINLQVSDMLMYVEIGLYPSSSFSVSYTLCSSNGDMTIFFFFPFLKKGRGCEFIRPKRQRSFGNNSQVS